MATLIIEPTKKTPEINFNAEAGQLSLTGMSCSENALGFFQPIYQWLEENASVFPEGTTFLLKLKYYNTSSAKCILELLDKVAAISSKNTPINITWDIEGDDDMRESAENYSSIIDYPIEIIG